MDESTGFEGDIPAWLAWFNRPPEIRTGAGLWLRTEPRTDFWQGTHYGFRTDNGHALLAAVSGDFSVTTSVSFAPRNQYDQCGLLVRVDAQNWIKMGIEYETATWSALGSVATNLGYSDWATTEVSSRIARMWYRISRRGADFLLQSSADGAAWTQMRITHLHAAAPTLHVGVYACSPLDGSFTCTFDELAITPNRHFHPEQD